MQASEAVGGEAFPPLSDRVAVAVEFVGQLLISEAVSGRAEDEAAAEDQGLWRRAGADEGVQLLLKFGRQHESRCEGTWHERLPCCREDTDRGTGIIMQRPGAAVQ